MPCAFCEIVAGRAPASRVYEDEDALGFLDARPVFKGHVLVVPRAHVDVLGAIPPALLPVLFRAVQRVALAVEQGLGADGTFVAMNNRVSQSVPHLHVHVVPRRRGDGLRGFFWPRQRYASAEELEEHRARIARALGMLDSRQ